jgi:peptidoglycan hydrolase-like protein with peptidoglycan-binding domain
MRHRKIGWVLIVVLSLTLLWPLDAPAQGERQVLQAQRRLQALGFDPGPIDGVLGPRTEEAIREYQRTQGLRATGVLDAETRAALGLGRRPEGRRRPF